MAEDSKNGAGGGPESLLPYDVWMEQALRGVVTRALAHTVAHGLPGAHHFYITFRTDFPGVVMPPRLRQKYPQEMTIVLQHQFDDLQVDEAGRSFSVSLSFGGVLSPLHIPLEAVSGFVDPHVQYGLQFRVAVPKPAPLAVAPPAPAPAAVKPATAAPDAAPQVVSLDAFRKRRD